MGAEICYPHFVLVLRASYRTKSVVMAIDRSRRTAIKTLGALGGSLALGGLPLPAGAQPKNTLRLGVIADLHGGLAVDADERLDAFLAAMKTASCDALVQMGDFAFPNAKHQRFPDKFNAAHPETIHVIGNHEFDFGLTRQHCYRAWGIRNSYYRRDLGALRILVLDGNDQGSPTHKGGYPTYIGDTQRHWLEQELKAATQPLLIFSHQPLAGVSAINNADAIQQLLAKYRSKILLCLNGHSHVDSLVQVDGVPYCHINSASYFWVGGETRMARYQDPLFTILTIDLESWTVEMSGVKSAWKERSPKALGYFNRENPPPESIVTPQIRPRHLSHTELKVMTWNIWGKLNQDPRYTVGNKTARERTIEIIEASGADVVAMIETYGSAAEIAHALDFHHYTSAADANLCIFSRYPLKEASTPEGLSAFSYLAATIIRPGGQPIRVYDLWLTSGGRHIVAIKDATLSDEAFTRGDDNRLDHLKPLLDQKRFQTDLAQADEVPLIVAGDFNCVSHLDHTQATKEAGLNHGRVLPIEVSRAMARLGFEDSYRATHPKITANTLGHTWTTVGKNYRYESGKGFVPTDNHPRPEYQDPYARIDYIYSKGKPIRTIDSQTLTRHPAHPEKAFPEFPSDHAAVLTTFKLQKASAPI